MDDPLQNNGRLIKKIEDDIEVLIMLQTATALSSENLRDTDMHGDRNNEFSCIPESNNDSLVSHEDHAMKYRSGKDIYPHEHINIRLRCSPSKSKDESNNSQGSNYRQKYFSCSQAKLTKTEPSGRCRSLYSRTSSRCLAHLETKTVQDNKYSKLSPENDDYRSTVKENWSTNDSTADMNDRYDRLYRDMEKLKKSVGELIKVKTENGDLQSQLASLQRERNSLLALAEAKEDSIKNIESSLNQMECECKCMIEEKENKIQALMTENSELAKKVKEFDKKIAKMQAEAQHREKSYTKELAKQPSADEFRKQKDIWEGKLKEYQCIITEKDSCIQEIQEKYQELEVMLGKVEEESQRSLLAEKELTNSNIALEGKLSETEKSAEELQEKVKLLEKEKEEKVSELMDAVKESNERIEELIDENKKLEESLRLQTEDLGKKDEEIKLMKEESRTLSEHIEKLQDSITEKESAELNKQKEELENSTAKNGETSGGEANDESPEMTKSSESEKAGGDLAPIDSIKQELDEARKSLEQEKKEVLRRGKIILEYEESIKKLKEQASQRIEELQRAITEKERTEINMKTSFYQERRQNEILLNELTKLKWHENQLTQELNETLQQLSEYEMENAETEEAFIEHSSQLQEIEDEVEKKTEQWYTYVVKLTQERDAAISSARSAREKLLVSLTEFQKHFAVQRKVQEVLTGMLRQREYDLKIALTKIVESRCIHSVADSNTSFETDV